MCKDLRQDLCHCNFLWRNIRRNDLPQFIELLTYSEAMLVLGHQSTKAVTGRATIMATA